MMDTNLDMFDRLQFKHVPVSYRNRVIERLGFNDFIVGEIIDLVLGWKEGDIELPATNNKHEQIKRMFAKLQSQDTCDYFCSDPENHFASGSCAPIGMIRDRMLQANEPINFFEVIFARKNDIWKYLIGSNPEFQKIWTSNNPHPGGTLYIYKLPKHTSKTSFFSREESDPHEMNVLIMDTVYMEHSNPDVVRVALNLYENTENNFSTFLVPSQQHGLQLHDWQDFVEKQIAYNADCIIILLTTNYHELQCNTQRHENQDRDRLKHFNNKVHNKPLFVCILSGQDLREAAKKMSAFVYELPGEMQTLLLAIRRTIRLIRANSKPPKIHADDVTESTDDIPVEVENEPGRPRTDSVIHRIGYSIRDTGSTIYNMVSGRSASHTMNEEDSEREYLLNHPSTSYSSPPLV